MIQLISLNLHVFVFEDDDVVRIYKDIGNQYFVLLPETFSNGIIYQDGFIRDEFRSNFFTNTLAVEFDKRIIHFHENNA